MNDMYPQTMHRQTTNRWHRGLIAAAVLGTGFVLGGLATGAWRQPAFGQNAAPSQRMSIQHSGEMMVPAVSVENETGFAVVGATDGRWYVIYRDGTSIPVFGDGRRVDLYWK